MAGTGTVERRRRGRRSTGFTLIEVVIVVIIVGILMTIALPGYQESMRKGRRADAKAGLMDAANRQERLMLDRRTYTEDMTVLGYDEDPMLTEDEYYEIDAVACSVDDPIETCYVLTATPAAGSPQEKDLKCDSFILNSSGAKTATGTTDTECW